MVFPQSSERGEVSGDGDGHSVLQPWAARSRSSRKGSAEDCVGIGAEMTCHVRISCRPGSDPCGYFGDADRPFGSSP